MNIEILGLLFSIFLGTLGHFLYELTNRNKIIGFLFSKNETLIEHIKLGVTPILLWIVIELFTINNSNLLLAKFLSILVFIFVLSILYFLYKFFIKKNILLLDILIFYVSLTISYILSMYVLISCVNNIFLNFLGIFGIFLVLFSYKIFN